MTGTKPSAGRRHARNWAAVRGSLGRRRRERTLRDALPLAWAKGAASQQSALSPTTLSPSGHASRDAAGTRGLRCRWPVCANRAIPARPAKRRRCAWPVKTCALGCERCGGHRACRDTRAACPRCGGSAAGNFVSTTLARVFATRRCARATMRRHPTVSCGDRRGSGRLFSGAQLLAVRRRLR
jgi:hypothetical protein